MGASKDMENSRPTLCLQVNGTKKCEENGEQSSAEASAAENRVHSAFGAQLAASTSSPSLLDGCGDPTTPTGANIERHIHSHHLRQNSVTSHGREGEFLSHMSTQTTPVPSPAILSDPPDSVFLIPAPPRQRNLTPERPSSAPPHHLERVSGTLLRLVGDHYMCSTCGRELRTLGDQLTLETNLRHALSSGDVRLNQDQ